jgi:hypothetical protein
MPRDLLLTLESLSQREVERQLERVRSDRTRIEAQEATLLQVLNLLQTSDPKATRLSPEPEQDERKNPPSPAERISKDGDPALRAQTASADDRRRTILAIMHTNPDRAWSPRDLGHEMRARGDEITPSYLRTVLQRMVKKDELWRVEQGLYRILPSTAQTRNRLEPNGRIANGAGQERPLTERPFGQGTPSRW